MIDSKHTPGPWMISGDPYPHVRTADGRDCVLARDWLREPDGFLIAASPELFALADKVANLNPDAGEIGAGMLRTIVAMARAARSKAIGEGQ